MTEAGYLSNNCPHCGGAIEFPVHGVGEWIECPHCQQRIQLVKPALLARFLGGANPGGMWAIVLAGAMVSGTALFIYFDHRGEARERDRQQAAVERAKLDLVSRQDRQKESSASATDRAQAEQSAKTEAMLKSLQKDIQDLRETNALLVSKLANQQNAPEAPQQVLKAQPQAPRRIRVYEILVPGYNKPICRTDIGQIVIQYLPDQVGKYWAEVRRLKAEEAEFRAKVEAYDQDARRASAVALTGASGDPAYVQAAMRQRAEANLMLENARDAKADLVKMQANLSAWERAEGERTTILAVLTGTQIARMDVWNCVGMAP